MLMLNDGRTELWQWDTGRTLAVDADCSQLHFSNNVFGRSIDVDVVDGVAIIPDILLQTDKDLNVWAFVGTSENGYTKISKTFKVNRRNKPADYVFTTPEQTTLAEIMERLDDLESIQDPDAIKNTVDDYLANNPITVKETDPTVPDWAKRPNPPDVKIPDKLPNPYSITFTGAVNISYDGSDSVEIKIPDSGGNVDLTGYATEEFVRNKIAEQIGDSMEVAIGSNRFNKNYTDDEFVYTDGWAIGKGFIATADGRGTITDNETRAVSHPILVENGDTYYFHMFTDGREFYSHYVFGYDRDGNYVDGSMSGYWVNQYTVPDGVSYIRLLVTHPSDVFNFKYIDVSTTQKPTSYSEYTCSISLIDRVARKLITEKNRVLYVDANGNGDFTTILEAVMEATKTFDSTVFVNTGVYDIIAEFEHVYGSDFFTNYSNASIDGIPLSNRVHLIFASNAKAICHYEGSNEAVMERFSPFRTGENGFVLENAHIVASRVRYVFHDERGTLEGNYKSEYKNCVMEFDNSNNTVWNSNSCIGGGLGRSGEIIIDGCYFNSAGIKEETNVKACVAYHNSAHEEALSNVVIKNNYIDGLGTFVFQYYGTTTKITKAIVTNNSIGSPIVCRQATSGSPENIVVYEWNNVVRAN